MHFDEKKQVFRSKVPYTPTERRVGELHMAEASYCFVVVVSGIKAERNDGHGA